MKVMKINPLVLDYHPIPFLLFLDSTTTRSSDVSPVKSQEENEMKMTMHI